MMKPRWNARTQQMERSRRAARRAPRAGRRPRAAGHRLRTPPLGLTAVDTPDLIRASTPGIASLPPLRAITLMDNPSPVTRPMALADLGVHRDQRAELAGALHPVDLVR